MKYIAVFIILIFSSISLFSQDDDNPVMWSHELNRISDTEYELIISGKIFEGWHVYSQFTADGGSLPSEFTYEKAGLDYDLVGITRESATETAYSDIFEVEETFFKKEAVFTQKIRLLNPDIRQVDVNLFYQVCKEVCIAIDKDFHFVLDGGEATIVEKTIDDRSLALGAALQLDLKNTELLNDGNSQVSSKSNICL